MRRIIVGILAVLILNLIMNEIVVSADCVVVRIFVGWFVVVSLVL